MQYESSFVAAALKFAKQISLYLKMLRFCPHFLPTVRRVLKTKMATGHWWNDTSKVKQTYSEQNTVTVPLCPQSISHGLALVQTHIGDDVSNQQDATTFSFIHLFKSALHVSGDTIAHPQEHFLLYVQLLVQYTNTAADRCHG